MIAPGAQRRLQGTSPACRRVPFCPRCGAQVAPEAAFCTSCGATLGEGALATPPPATAAPPALAPDAWGTPPPAEQPRPVGVTVLGVLYLVFSGLAALVALAFLVGGSALAALIAQEADLAGGIVGAALGFVAVVIAVFAALGIAVGVGLLKRQTWAWVVAIVFEGFSILGGLGGLAEGDWTSIVGLLIAGLILWYLLTPNVRGWFQRRT